jgi:hypothetical protein
VASVLKHFSIFVAVNGPLNLPMVGVGTKTLSEGDKLLITSPPTRSHFTITRDTTTTHNHTEISSFSGMWREPHTKKSQQDDLGWRYHAIIIRPSQAVNDHYRVAGEAIVFINEEYSRLRRGHFIDFDFCLE